MTVNHSSVLSVDYFDAYFKLVLASREPGWKRQKNSSKQTFLKAKHAIMASKLTEISLRLLTSYKDKLKIVDLNSCNMQIM